MAVDAIRSEKAKKRADNLKAAQKAEDERAREAEYQRLIQEEADAQVAAPPSTKEEWENHITKCLGKSVNYITDRLLRKSGIDGDARYLYASFMRCARIFDPRYAKTLTVTRANELIDGLSFYNKLDACIPELKATFAAYQAQATTHEPTSEKINFLFWHKKMNGDESPWFRGACLVVLLCPSSAAAERTFSLLKELFTDRQQNTLVDSIQFTLMANINKSLI